LDRAVRGKGEAQVRALQEVGGLAIRGEGGRRIAVVTGLRAGGIRPCHRTDPRGIRARTRRALRLSQAYPQRIACRMLARVAAAVTRVRRAHVAIVSAGRSVRFLDIRRAGLSRHASARLSQVAFARGGSAGGPRRSHNIGGTDHARPVTDFAGIAQVRGSGTTDEGIGLHAVGRTGRAAPRACFGRVASVRRRATDRSGIADGMLAEHAGAVAGVARAGIAVVGARRTARPLAVRRTGLSRRTGTALGHVALPGRGPAHRAAGRDDVHGTALVRPVAALGRIARVSGPGAAHERAGLDAVGWTGRADPRADLDRVARAARRATDRSRVADAMLADHAAAVAGIGRARVAVVGADRAARLEDAGR